MTESLQTTCLFKFLDEKQGLIERHVASIFAARTEAVRVQHAMHQNYAIREEIVPPGQYLKRLANREISIIKHV